MKCGLCGYPMNLDNTDVINENSESKDYYYICHHCGASALERVRNGIVLSITFDSSEDK